MDQCLVFQHVCAFPCVKVCVYLYAPLYIVNLCVYVTWYIVNLRIPFPIRDFVYSEPTCIRGLVNGEPVYTFLSSFLLFACYIVIFHLRVSPSRTTLVSYLYLMPTISPFVLDGNNHTKSLSPFDIKGKERTKIFSPLIYILMSILPLSTC